MNNSSIRKVKKSLSESCLLRKSSFSKSLNTNDPFRNIATKQTKTPVLKPTCHKIYSIEKSIHKLVENSTKPKKLVSVMSGKFNSSVFKAQFPFNLIKTKNPVFSAKDSDKKIKVLHNEQVKPIIKSGDIRKNKAELIIQKNKVPCLNKRMMKRVNSLIFKEKRYDEKTSLDFSFADPD